MIYGSHILQVSLDKDDTEIIHNHDGKLGYKLVVENVDTAGMVNFHIKPLHDVPNIFAKYVRPISKPSLAIGCLNS